MTVNSKVVELSGDAITIKERSPFQIVMMRFRKHRLAMIALVIISIIFIITILAPYITNFEVAEISVGDYFLPFGSLDADTGRVHIMGTDHIGRDYFSRLIFAGRISLTVAFISVIISETTGVILGAISGYYGGVVDNVMMRFVEFMLTVPSLPLLLIISSMLLANENLIPIPPIVLNVVGKLMLLSPRDTRSAVLIIMVLAGFGWLGSCPVNAGHGITNKTANFR